jgi:tetratricopeptide (TPR) repeat protein
LITGVLGLALVAILVAAVQHWRARRTIAAMSTLMMAGEHDRVLAHRAPPKAYRPLADRLRATSALLTGRNDLALRLLDTGRVSAAVAGQVGAIDLHLRAGALIAMGRYGEALAVLGDDPSGAIARHQRAQIGVETGDDATALRLLEVPDTEPDEEAGRLRILGDLHIRRGRLSEGEALVRRARAAYAVSAMPAHEVDTGYCHYHLGEAALARTDAAGALAQLTTALALLSVRPDNAPGLATVHARLGEAYALSGKPEPAQQHLHEARQFCELVGSPSLSSMVERSHGLVALHLGRVEDARRHLSSARAGHLALAETPAADWIAGLLTELDATS